MGIEDQFRSVVYPLLRFTVFASQAFLFGLIPILLLVLRPAYARLPDDGGWRAGRARVALRLEGLVRACLLAAATATALVLLLQTALVSEISEVEVSWDGLTSVLQTTFGQWQALRLPLLAGLAVLLMGSIRSSSLAGTGDGGRAPGPVWWWSWGALSAMLLATSTLSGHAMVATPRSVAIPNDILHLLSGSTWFAGIVILAIVLPDAWLRKEPPARLLLLAPAVVRFSYLALVSIGIVGTTGLVNGFLHVGALEDLWMTGYGRAVVAKLMLLGMILMIGGINHLYVREKLRRAVEDGVDTEARRIFRKTIAAELVIALGLMAATGLLVGLTRTGPTNQEATPPGTASPRQSVPAGSEG